MSQGLDPKPTHASKQISEVRMIGLLSTIENKRRFYEAWKKGWMYFYANDLTQAKKFFEEAHYYGVFSTSRHFLAHKAKFQIACRERKFCHCILQLFLMVLAPLSLITYGFYKINIFLPMHPLLKQQFDKEMEITIHFYRIYYGFKD